MKYLKITICVAAGLIAGAAFGNSNGDNNGRPFQELQEAVDAAVAAEAAARESADDALEAALDAEAAAREAADTAEETARIAGDNALSAALAAEEAARIAADAALQAEIGAHAALLLDLDERVAALEGTTGGQSVTWVENGGVFDVTNLPADVISLNYQPGNWVAFVSRHVSTGVTFGNCTNNASVAPWLDAVVSGTNYNSGWISGAGSFFLSGASWFNSPSLQLNSRGSSGPYLQIFSSAWNHFVIDRLGTWHSREVYSYYNGGGYGVGNELTLTVGPTRLDACGF